MFQIEVFNLIMYNRCTVLNIETVVNQSGGHSDFWGFSQPQSLRSLQISKPYTNYSNNFPAKFHEWTSFYFFKLNFTCTV